MLDQETLRSLFAKEPADEEGEAAIYRVTPVLASEIPGLHGMAGTDLKLWEDPQTGELQSCRLL